MPSNNGTADSKDASIEEPKPEAESKPTVSNDKADLSESAADNKPTTTKANAEPSLDESAKAGTRGSFIAPMCCVPMPSNNGTADAKDVSIEEPKNEAEAKPTIANDKADLSEGAADNKPTTRKDNNDEALPDGADDPTEVCVTVNHSLNARLDSCYTFICVVR